MSGPDPETFAREGYLGPLPLFTAEECQRIAAYLRREDHPAPAEWQKGRAVSERFLYDLAVHPRLIALVTNLLGDDVILWGASAVSRDPGQGQPAHTDIESSDPRGRFVSVWIGIENTSRDSALKLITRSHHFGRTVQEERSRRGMAREAGTTEALFEAARLLDPEVVLVQPEMGNGEALLFDGRLWHGSDNSRKSGRRVALLLQYASAGSEVRIPDLTQLDWPFRLRAAPLPPVILVAGSEQAGVNRLAPAPAPLSPGRPMIVTAIHRFDLPSATERFQSFFAFCGPTRTFGDMSCHASVLPPGETPHLPHAHVEEEMLIALRGEVELLIADSPGDPSPRPHRVRPGTFVYYPAGQHHTIRNPGSETVSYLMFKWHAARTAPAGAPLETSLWHYGEIAAPADATPFWTQRIFEGPTVWLRKLHAHLTILQPGGGYDAHVDAYDVAIVLLEGAIETLGQRVEPLSVIYYAAGEPHGMRNPGNEPARYLVFEFHAPGVEPMPRRPPLAARVVRLARRLARPIWRRVRPYVRRGRR